MKKLFDRGTSASRLALASALLALTFSSAAFAQTLVPTDFFNAPVNSADPAEVESSTLTFDSAKNLITASGDVVLRQSGYTLTGQNLVYDRSNQTLKFTGNVTVLDPSGNLAEMSDADITGGMKQAFLNALTITAYDGSRITADSADYASALRTILDKATYAPCGDCIDDREQRIGWKVNTSSITYNSEDGSLYLEQPTLEVLGLPVAWLPYLWIPDLSASTVEGFRTPNYSYTDEVGHKVEVPYYAYSSRWTDVILTPTFMTRQGFLLGAEWLQRFDNGAFQIKASGLYQWEKEAFGFADAQRDWRGAIQTSGSFTPIENWTAGWSYTEFTDAAYLDDYGLTTGTSSVNQVYATNVTDDTFLDVRVQKFNRIGDYTDIDQGEQAATLPAVRFNHIQELAPGNGRVEISGRLLGVQREYDSTTSSNGVPYIFGYSGGRQHASVQAGWQNQYIGGGGFVATPYLGGRTDFAYYDGTSADPTQPGETSLFSLTPIAAMDVRFPVAANDGSTVHLIEPIAQLAYRGSGTTSVGITNDDAQSFVFDDTNLFSYNRFSGYDRQETGLRLNVGGRYQANFIDGSYIELVAGQSFHLAGENAFDTVDQAQTGVGAGLSGTASYAVLGAYAGFESGIRAGGKLQVDTEEPAITRASLSAGYANDGWAATADYNFIAANEAAGVVMDQHEIGGSVTVPVAEYWSLQARTYWDIASNNYLQVGGGVTYDDGYLMIGADAYRNGPTHTSPDETRVTASFKLKAPAGLDFGFATNAVVE
ncbi:MAG: LPS assembly protein LptD [Candidatus Devosia phytovorans]|uniref:LPS-assembly protein LptD n=1 Tax=Candidatus Devosia phytovorans TaxID=3121372 RepID=A0AAJ6B3M1_9HYPH|nr:LPS assembly protein LptD [Devosia sp.]WEK06593.1 MAG: LPS assembly protein LptD [Devosia sp.]